MLHTLMHSPWQSDVAGRISLLARGLTEQISANIRKVGYNGFVELTVRHPQQLAW